MTKAQDNITAVAHLDYSSCEDTSASSDIELGILCCLPQHSQLEPYPSFSEPLYLPVNIQQRTESCGEVLTSLENIQIMEVAKQEKARLKECKKAREKACKKASNSGDVQTCILLLIEPCMLEVHKPLAPIATSWIISFCLCNFSHVYVEFLYKALHILFPADSKIAKTTNVVSTLRGMYTYLLLKLS